jgi:hypothetical protein
MDYSARAAKYLTALGWVSLLGLNLGGLLWLWLAARVRARSNGARRWAIALLAVHAAMFIAVAVLAQLRPQQTTFRIFGNATHLPPVLVMGIGLVAAAVFVLPLVWLSAPGTREACRSATMEPWAARCERCSYDLTGNVSGVCPECGTEILKSAAESLN